MDRKYLNTSMESPDREVPLWYSVLLSRLTVFTRKTTSSRTQEAQVSKVFTDLSSAQLQPNEISSKENPSIN